MKQTLTFNPSIFKSTASKINVDIWDTCIDKYDNKEYFKSFHLLLDYINPELRRKYGNSSETEYIIPHGTETITLKFGDKVFSATAPFMKLTEKNKIPMMRQAASLNFNNLYLTQIEQREGDLYFEYTCPTELVQPYKLYYVFSEICSVGDKYSAEFASKFGAEYVLKPKIKPFEPQTVDMVYDVIQLSCKECNDGVKYFENERKYGFAWNIIDCTLLKIMYYAHPQGQLLNDIIKVLNDMDKEEIPLIEANAMGKKMVEQLQSMSKEELSKYLYYTETFVSSKNRSTLKNIQENFRSPYEKISNYYYQADYMSVCVMITFQFYNMYFYNDLQDDINALVTSALKASSGLPWDKAAEPLYKAMMGIMSGNLTPVKGKSGGFFSSLFGKKK